MLTLRATSTSSSTGFKVVRTPSKASTAGSLEVDRSVLSLLLTPSTVLCSPALRRCSRVNHQRRNRHCWNCFCVWCHRTLGVSYVCTIFQKYDLSRDTHLADPVITHHGQAVTNSGVCSRQATRLPPITPFTIKMCLLPSFTGLGLEWRSASAKNAWSHCS